MLIYEDDIILTGNSSSTIQKFISHLSIVFHMKDLGELHYFLGVQVVRDVHALTLTQSRYLLSLLQKFGMDGAKPISTPLASRVQVFAMEGSPLPDPKVFRQMVASLQYLTLTRPDIAYVKLFLCQFMQTLVSLIPLL